MPRHEEHTETDLLSLLCNGDREAFTQFFEIYRDKLYSFILHLSGSPEMAGDVLQDVFLKIWYERAALSKVKNFNAYLFRMARNRAINLLLRRSHEALILKEIGYNQRDSVQVEDALAGQEMQEFLHQAMKQLPPQQRMVFELSREEGLKYEEIASRLGLSTSTVRNHMVHALRSVRKFMRSVYPESSLYCLLLVCLLCR